MGEVIGLGDRQPKEPLQLAIQGMLTATGSARGDAAELGVTVEAWRKAARAAGRELGRPLQTVASGTIVHAVLKDWPRDEAERRIHDEAMWAALGSISLR
ncbi:hypothetical protein AB3K78_15490 [Leucobacter sp. HNU]|uniref:hypothetical protein n=1 Tax=Leucobacter sp. HNU TaxID=3236805 RepID=UPI003A7FF897